MNLNSNHYIYTHWLRITSKNELAKWESLKQYKDKHDCYMTVFYYDYDPFGDKVIKLDCNQSLQELDLDVNSTSEKSLTRIKAKPTNATSYTKGINYFFKEKLGIDYVEKNHKKFNINEEDLVTVDALSEFKKLENIELFAQALVKENWRIVKIKSDRGYHYQLYFGKDRQFKNRFEYAFSQFMYKSRMEDRLQRFINNYLKSYEVNLESFIGHKINSFKAKYEFVSGERIGVDIECIGLVLGINDNKIDMFDFKKSMKEQFYSIDLDVVKKNYEEGFYKVNYNLLSNLEKMQLTKYQNNKLDKFSDLCGDWDYRRNIDMTHPHLQSISISRNTISIFCEKFSTDLDDYVSCDAGKISSKNLVTEFKILDLTNKENVVEFMRKIENHIDFDKVNDDLYNEEQNQLKALEKEDLEEELDYEI